MQRFNLAQLELFNFETIFNMIEVYVNRIIASGKKNVIIDIKI
jgi:hypothetical protein